jgi:threonine aldolase
MIDLRSDTVTKPTEGMRKAMYNAEVGDDVFKEDPTANAFQEKIAALFGMEAGVFVPSGTMGNQLAVNIQTLPGDEIIIDATGHIYNYESAAGPFSIRCAIHDTSRRAGHTYAGAYSYWI